MRNSIPSWDDVIRVRRARENNLKDVSVQIPKNKYILVTGVSGSGKSSLVHGVIAAEAKRRYLEQLNPKLRTLMAGVKKPEVEKVEGLSPVVSLDQIYSSHTIRSTVGTLSGLYDHFRLLFARYGMNSQTEVQYRSKSYFSFNQAEGACQNCQGIGEEEYIDPSTFIVNPAESVKNGALSLTTPTGYVIYSQVTLDVLQLVCEAEDFSLDIPWEHLTDEQKGIIYYGSEAIKVPFGKHTLESRMKWTGITAKPREEGYFRGVLTIMEEILKRDRNKNILKYTKSRKCPVCEGKRLNQSSLQVLWQGKDIGDWSAFSIIQLISILNGFLDKGKLSNGEIKLVKSILNQLISMEKLGLGYLQLNRETRTLSGGETKRIRLSSLVQPELSGLIYTLDEPTVGLHPQDHNNLLDLLKEVQDQGNTLICIDHKFFSFKRADYWIEIGPGAGKNGGEIILNDWLHKLIQNKDKLTSSKTWQFLTHEKQLVWNPKKSNKSLPIKVLNARVNNLKDIHPTFYTNALNVICGVSGAGKSSLLNGVLFKDLEMNAQFKKIVKVNQDPIGRSPRSNPMTYTKAFDKIRDLFAIQEESKKKNFSKSHFSFNVKGGRCPKCMGAGKIEIGMSFLGKAETDCDLCFGHRFDKDVLEVKYKGLNIAEVLNLEVSTACDFFADRPEIIKYISLLNDLGLGYLHLGQSSSTLSGGEAQRVKLVSELVKGKAAETLYLLDEPSNGLHYEDISVLLKGLEKLIENGNTIIIVEHDPNIVRISDWIVELGPGAGDLGGEVIFEGSSTEMESGNTSMAVAIREAVDFKVENYGVETDSKATNSNIELKSISTNNLKNIDISIPIGKITAIAGISGSGKSSLAFETLYARSKFQYSQIFSPYIRTLLGNNMPGEIEEVRNLLPVVGIQYNQTKGLRSSTVGTLLGISPVFRLLFSRFSIDSEGNPCSLWAKHFSFMDSAGACPKCQGFGTVLGVSESLLISNSQLSIKNGAMAGSKPGLFFSDPNGQYMASFYTMADAHNISVEIPWNKYSEKERNIILHGTGQEEYNVVWKYNRKGRTGEHSFMSLWEGFIPLIKADFHKKTGTTRQTVFKKIMLENQCELCEGSRIHPDRHKYQLLNRNISEWFQLSLNDLISQLGLADPKSYLHTHFEKLVRVLKMAIDLGLGYLNLNRSANSLSSGEYQRIRLAGQIESGLSGLLYVLDEPGSSLHPENMKKLSKVFENLRDKGNTIVFTEHKEELIKTADYLIELGPGAGRNGGEIVNQGFTKDIIHDTEVEIKQLPVRQLFEPKKLLASFSEIEFRNLRIPALEIPLGWVSISGVSGSGKSTLLNEIVSPALSNDLAETRAKVEWIASGFSLVNSSETIRRWSWRKTPLMVLGLENQLFKQFANTPKANSAKVKAGDFYPTRKGLACEKCQGRGNILLSLDFLGESSQSCSSCDGTGYKSQIKDYRINNLDLPTILELDLDSIWDFLPENETNKLLKTTINEIGIGYLKIGQHGNTLSSGEQQRLILSQQLVQKDQSKKIYLFDEPTRGLHRKSINGFCKLVKALADLGHSVISIDHDPAVIALSDWMIQIGPGAGDEGGLIEYAGKP